LCCRSLPPMPCVLWQTSFHFVFAPSRARVRSCFFFEQPKNITLFEQWGDIAGDSFMLFLYLAVLCLPDVRPTHLATLLRLAAAMLACLPSVQLIAVVRCPLSLRLLQSTSTSWTWRLSTSCKPVCLVEPNCVLAVFLLRCGSSVFDGTALLIASVLLPRLRLRRSGVPQRQSDGTRGARVAESLHRRCHLGVSLRPFQRVFTCLTSWPC
jgi:hypothetical protein